MNEYKHDGIGGYDKKVVSEFNKISSYFDSSDLLDIILSNWADDKDLSSITNFLKDRLFENRIINNED